MSDSDKVQYVDTHAHIYLKNFEKDRPDIIRKAGEYGVNKIYMPNLDHASIDDMMECEHKFPGICIPMMGLHPTYIKKGFEKELYLVEEWLGKRKFAAVGEVGLDFYWDLTFRKEQEEALKIQVAFAEKHQLPLVIHCRESVQETIDLLKHTGNKISGIFHCFSGTLEQAQEAVEMGLYLGIGGAVTFKNAGLDKILPDLKISNLVLETDCPYLTPVPFRKERNDPSYIPLIANKVAEVMKLTVEEVAKVTTDNAFKIFQM